MEDARAPSSCPDTYGQPQMLTTLFSALHWALPPGEAVSGADDSRTLRWQRYFLILLNYARL